MAAETPTGNKSADLLRWLMLACGRQSKGQAGPRWQLIAAAQSTSYQVALSSSSRKPPETVSVACMCRSWWAWPMAGAVQLHPAAPAGAGQHSIGVQAAR